ncbi:unnamed protein product [Malus baccata var. baccata]
MEHRQLTSSNLERPDQEKATRVVLVSYPIQGHVAPFIKLSYLLASRGIKVTLVVTEFLHARLMASQPELDGEQCDQVRLVAVPDGLPEEDPRSDERKVGESIFKVMPGHLENLLNKANLEGNQVACIIADAIFGWALEFAEKREIKLAMFWPSTPGGLALALSIPKLIEAGIIDSNGTPTMKGYKVQLSPDLPPLTDGDLVWSYPGNQIAQKMIFQSLFSIQQNLEKCCWILCNWFHELNPLVGDTIPNILPLGPLLANGKPAGTFWPEDSTCLSWLDRQPPRSVVYVAFGSIAKHSQHQIDELALGLELLGRPFLWVNRSALTSGSSSKFPDGYEKRIPASHGKIVPWAPQEKVLAHPSVACFLSHCGWNSTMDGISTGVPILCWPNFADQFYNRSCICDGYKVGLCLNPDEYGIVTRHEIRRKLENLIADEGIRRNSMRLKEMAEESLRKGGSSANNLESFIEQIKQ